MSPTCFVFTASGNSPFMAYDPIKRELDAAAGATGWTFHDARRTLATTLADRLGVMPHVVSAVLGHVHGDRVARIYNRANYIDEQRSALARWADHVTGLAEGRESRIVALVR